MKKYITYGLGNKFYPEKLVTDLTCEIGKPYRAWWGSPIDAEYGWKEWCENEDWFPNRKSITLEEYFNSDNSIIWTLEEGTKILEINTIEDLDSFFEKGYIKEYDSFDFKWNFYKVLEDGYSAIQLNDGYIGHYFKSRLELLMNSWDCESICVLDPSKIIILENETSEES